MNIIFGVIYLSYYYCSWIIYFIWGVKKKKRNKNLDKRPCFDSIIYFYFVNLQYGK